MPQWPSSRGLTCSSAQRLAQQRVVEQVDLADRQVVGGAPVGVDPAQLLSVERLRSRWADRSSHHSTDTPQLAASVSLRGAVRAFHGPRGPCEDRPRHARRFRPRARHRPLRRDRLHRRADRRVPRRARARRRCAGRSPGATARKLEARARAARRARPGVRRAAAAARRRRRRGVAARGRRSRRAWSSPPSARTSPTASRWSPPAPRPAPTTSTSPASRSSSTACTSRHHASARARPARGIVHACGFDSIPHDLGALFTVQQLPGGRAAAACEGFVRAGGTFSGGTFHSALTAFARAAPDAQPRPPSAAALEPAPRGPPRARASRGAPQHATRSAPGRCPLPTIDPQVVARSARALDRYGPDFTYGHYVAVKRAARRRRRLAGRRAARCSPLAQLPPARKLAARARARPARGRRRAAREGLVQGPLRRRGRRPAGGDRGRRRRPRLRRDGEDARRVRAVPGPRRPARDRRARSRPPAAMGDALRGRLESRAGPDVPRARGELSRAPPSAASGCAGGVHGRYGSAGAAPRPAALPLLVGDRPRRPGRRTSCRARRRS